MKILVFGALGKMGKAVIDQCLDEYKLGVVGGVDVSKGEYRGLKISISGSPEAKAMLKECDVCINFTLPEAEMKNIPEIISAKKDFVMGTTGFMEEDMEKIRKIVSESASCAIISPNFSPLVNVQMKMTETAVKLLSPMGYNFGLVEEHHNRKKDSPSGTAQKLLKLMLKNGAGERIVYRKEEIKAWEKGDVDSAVLRLGGTAGAHDVRIVGNYGRLEINSLMYSRADFAKGAIESALWLKKNRKNGKIFGFWDVLGLE